MNSDVLTAIVDIPESFRNRQVELIILPIDERVRKQTHKKSTYGILKQYANPDLIALEDGAWERAVRGKYTLR